VRSDGAAHTRIGSIAQKKKKQLQLGRHLDAAHL